MRSKFGLGAGFALTAFAIAVGCGSGNKTSIFSGGGELTGNGFPASPISQNNLAPDGGGFSNNNQDANIGQVKCAFNVPAPDGAATSTQSNTTADSTAMVVFATSNHSAGSGSSNGRQRVYAAYWSGQSFTPPQEITGVNRNEQITVGDPRATNVQSVVMIPFNTGQYNDPSGASPSLTRANQGNWVIVWDAQTLTNQVPGGTQNSMSDLIGPHHSLYVTMFIKSLSTQPFTSTSLIGNNAASGTANGKTAVKMQFGFQLIAPEVTLEVGGQGVGSVLGTEVSGFTDPTSARMIRPASDVVSYGAATDTFVHCATFGSNVNDVSGLLSGNNIGNVTTGKETLGATWSTLAGFNPLLQTVATPSAASYEVGDNTNFIQLFWVQMVTSHGGTGQTFVGNSSFSEAEIGPAYQLFSANLSLATMTLGASNDATVPTGQAIVAPPAARNFATFTAGDDRRAVATQALANFVAYNNLLFYNWIDASLNTTIGASVGLSNEGFVGTTVDGRAGKSEICTVLNIVPGANGTAAVAANPTDITMLGTAGRHSTNNSTAPGSAAPLDIGEEFVQLGQLCGSCGIIGGDEGQADVVAFVVGRVTTFTATGVIAGATTAGNVDNELWACLLTSQGAIETGGTNPRRVSEHFPEINALQTTVVTNNLTDAVGDIKVQPDRDGTYDILAWRQTTGTSLQSILALNAVVYKTAFIGSQSLVGAALPNLDARLTRPAQINIPATVAYTAQTSIVPNGWLGSPVAGFDFEGAINFRCGFQSDTTKLSILYLYSDGSDERVFIRQLTTNIGATLAAAPTLTLSTEAEIEPTASVSGEFVNNQVTGVSHGNPFHFLPGSHGLPIPCNAGIGSVTELNTITGNFSGGPGASCSNLSSGFDSVKTCDAGPAASGAGGDVLIVFSKTVTATLSGTVGFDHQVISVLFSNGVINAADRIVLSRGIAENTQSASSITLPFAVLPAVGPPSTYTIGFFSPNTTKTQLGGLVPNIRSASLSPGSLSPTNGTYIFMSDFVGGDVSSPRGIFSRHFRSRTQTQNGAAQVTFVNNFFPAAATDPVRLDNASSDSDATFLDALVNGRTWAGFFRQDNHIWCSETSDGETFTNKNGLSAPFLVDDNISANGNQNTTTLGFCKKNASTCDNLSGTIVAVVKDDVNLDQRIYIRVMTGQ